MIQGLVNGKVGSDEDWGPVSQDDHFCGYLWSYELNFISLGHSEFLLFFLYLLLGKIFE